MQTLLASLVATAAARPHAIALRDGTRTLDYAGLVASVRAFAGWLATTGIGPGDRVALVLPNRIEAVVACHAAWMVGAVVVPLNAQASTRELAAWLGHCRPSLVVREAGGAAAHAACRGLDIPCMVLDAGGAGGVAWDAAQALGTAAGEALAPPRLDDQPAAIVYTSGTTGAPKGVTLTDRNLAANTRAIVHVLGLHAGDRALSVLPHWYAYGASVINGMLAVGGSIVIAPNLVFPHLVADLLEEHAVTVFPGVASTFALMLDREAFAAHRLPRLRLLTQAGGPMPVALAARLRATLPQARLVTMYGQTEATARLACLPLGVRAAPWGAIGRALPGVDLEVRDGDGRVLPPGCEGELWARGGNIMAGYWNDPVATAGVLRDGWLRTGDIARIDAAGWLTLCGRRGDMIKTGAHRVHPAEIEDVLAAMPGVHEAAVAGVDDALLGQVLRAWIVADPALGTDRVRAWCRERLSAWKVPREVVFVPALPRTTSGKVQRAALATAACEDHP
jgi:long-chain acyl-CoA synthetase